MRKRADEIEAGDYIPYFGWVKTVEPYGEFRTRLVSETGTINIQPTDEILIVHTVSDVEKQVHQRVNQVLASNSKPEPICIVCREPITKQHNIISSIHGPYHGAPMTCVEGREEKEIH